MTADRTTPEDVLHFWLEDAGPARWYAVDPDFDREIASRFGPAVAFAASGGYADWTTRADGALALLVLLDQFSRNVHRGDARSFAADGRARAVAKRAIAQDLDRQVKEPERQFFYLPLMHAESPEDQARCVRLFMLRMPQTGAINLKHAIAHRGAIRRFGRFPGRNDALGRKSTPAERAYLASGGYGADESAGGGASGA